MVKSNLSMYLINFSRSIISSKLLRSTGIYTISKVINYSIPFFLLPIMTSYLSPSDYGIITMITTIASFIFPFVSWNFDSAIVRSYYKDNSISQYIGTCIITIFVLLVINTCVWGGLSSFLEEKIQVPYYVICIIPLYCVFTFFKNIVQYYWQVNSCPKKFGVFTISATALEVCISIFLVVVIGLNWKGRAISLFVTNMIVSCFAILFLNKKQMISMSFSKDYFTHAFKYGAGLIPHALGTSFLVLANRLFLTNMVSIEETGFYGVASSFANVLSFITLSFNNAYVPWLFEKLNMNDSGEKRKIVKVTYLYFAFLVVIGIVVIFAIKLFFPLFVNQSFLTAFKYIPWLILGLVFQGFYFMVTNYILYSEKTVYNGLVTIVAGIISVILSYILIKMYGAVGASIAFACTYFIYFILAWIVSNSVFHMPWFNSSLQRIDK